MYKLTEEFRFPASIIDTKLVLANALISTIFKERVKVQEGKSVEHELNDERVPPLIDVIDALHNGAREHEQQILKTGIQFSAWSFGGDV